MGLNGKMTAEEAAEFIGIDGTNLRKKLQKGLIPYERHGRAYVLNVEDVEAFKATFQPFAKTFDKSRQQ